MAPHISVTLDPVVREKLADTETVAKTLYEAATKWLEQQKEPREVHMRVTNLHITHPMCGMAYIKRDGSIGFWRTWYLDVDKADKPDE